MEVKKHPFITFEELTFRNGEPDFGVVKGELEGVKYEETLKF
jgi:hypothetical protein